MNRPIESVADAQEFFGWCGYGIQLVRDARVVVGDPMQTEIVTAIAIASARAVQDLFRKAGKL